MSNDDLLQYKVSRIYSLCFSLFYNEFKLKFLCSKEEFRDWLNLKTGLNVDHIQNKETAFTAWLEQLENMKKATDYDFRIP